MHVFAHNDSSAASSAAGAPAGRTARAAAAPQKPMTAAELVQHVRPLPPLPPAPPATFAAPSPAPQENARRATTRPHTSFAADSLALVVAGIAGGLIGLILLYVVTVQSNPGLAAEMMSQQNSSLRTALVLVPMLLSAAMGWVGGGVGDLVSDALGLQPLGRRICRILCALLAGALAAPVGLITGAMGGR